MWRKLRAAALLTAIAAASSGFVLAQDGYGYPGRDRDRYYDRGNYYDYNQEGMRIARSTGYSDGARMAYSDLRHGKPFSPYPRGKFAHADHGYHHEYGDKYAYREAYARGYRAGYEATFRR